MTGSTGWLARPSASQGRITRLEMQPCEADGRASQPGEPVMVPAGVPG